MPTPAITVENLGKAYRLGTRDESPDTLVGALQGMVRAPVKNWRRLAQLNTFRHCDERDDLFWALRDVSFEVAEGEVLGVIGRNGAGKSTLLKILSRITEPTHGRAVIRGRVSSLLEVGTGFHPELSGRDNVYMNGTILGMTKREIDRKFDEIVDFSGVEKFLDTPIKRYSSGMKVRLAFAVAAHLEPEILIIDEVLAVGDAEFQRKCLGKMQDVARGGRTVLFVSHNMAAIENLCTHGIALSGGMVSKLGPVDDVVASYIESNSTCSQQRMRRNDDFEPVLKNVVIQENGLSHLSSIRCGGDLLISIEFESNTPLPQSRVGLRIDTLTGTPITHIQSEIATGQHLDLASSGIITCHVRRLPLVPGSYSLVVALFSKGVLVDHLNPAVEFDVEAGDFFNTGRLPSRSLGAFLLPSEWDVATYSQ